MGMRLFTWIFSRWYEFLNIHINRKKPSEEDKEKKRLAAEIRSRREHDLIVEDNGLIDKKRKLADFKEFLKAYLNSKTPNHLSTATLYQLNEFIGKRSLLSQA